MRIGYARVSIEDQNPLLQLDALKAAGCERIYQDQASGPRDERRELDQALDAVGPGDELVVWRLDRIGRSLPHLVKLIERLGDNGIAFRSLTENIETLTLGSPVVTRIFVALAQFERDIIRERTRDGLAAARARGRRGGRKSIEREKIAAMRAMWDSQTMTADAIASQLGIHRATVFKYLKNRS